jgi:archaellum biogenesis ATPase FlaH
MASLTNYKNMFSEEDDSYESDCDSVYSGTSLDIVEVLGDRDYDDEEPLQTEANQLDDDQEDFDEKNRYADSLIQNSDDMVLINKAREMPSEYEMNTCFHTILNTEILNKHISLAVKVIEKWWVLCLCSKVLKTTKKQIKDQWKELSDWKTETKQNKRFISQLTELVPLQVQYKQMMVVKHSNKMEKEKASIIIVHEHSRLANIQADTNRRAATAARNKLKNEGMNKKSKWHTDQAFGGYALKSTEPKNSKTGSGRRSFRKVKNELYHVVKEQVVEKNEEQDEQDEQDEQELVELVNINRLCVEKNNEREMREKVDALEKKLEKEIEIAFFRKKADELNEFVDTMIKNKKKTKKFVETNFKSLFAQKKIYRMVNDTQYTARCNGFEDLGNKEKLVSVLKYTSLCNSVTNKKKCYHKNCRFAHSIDQLVEKHCRFGIGCKFVKQMANGQYQNQVFASTRKTCSFMHTGEDKQGFCLRMGLPTPVLPTPVLPTPVLPKPVLPTPVLPKPVLPTLPTQNKNTKTEWCDVVVNSLTLTSDQKTSMVSDKTESSNAFQITIRKQGLLKLVDVVQSGFNYEKDDVVFQPIKEKTQQLDIAMEKVFKTVELINKRVMVIDSINMRVTNSIDDTDNAMEKVFKTVELINKRVMVIDSINMRVTNSIDDTDNAMEKVVKAVELINKRVMLIDSINKGVCDAMKKETEINNRLMTDKFAGIEFINKIVADQVKLINKRVSKEDRVIENYWTSKSLEHMRSIKIVC